MSLNLLSKVNYNFARNIFPRAVVRNPELFYSKYIAAGHNSFIESIKSAWLNCSVSSDYESKNISLDVAEIEVDISHVYENGDFFLLTTLPKALNGSDLIGLYVYEVIDEEGSVGIGINYYILYVSQNSDRYSLLTIDKDLKIKNLGYISTHKQSIIRSIYNINKRQYKNAR